MERLPLLQPSGVQAKDPRNPERVQADGVAGGDKPEALLAQLEERDRLYLDYVWDSTVVVARALRLIKEEELSTLYDAHKADYDSKRDMLVTKVDDLATQVAQAREDKRGVLTSLHNTIVEKRDVAAKCCAEVGVAVDMRSPDSEAPFQRPVGAEGADTAPHDLIKPGHVKNRLFNTFITLFMGAFTGISIYLGMGGRLGPGRDDMLTAVATGVGITALAVIGAVAFHAVRLWARNAQRAKARLPLEKCLPWLRKAMWFSMTLAFLLAAALILVESSVAFNGVIAEIQRRLDLSHQLEAFRAGTLGTNEENRASITYYFLALLVSLPFVSYKAYQGWYAGEDEAALTLLGEENAREILKLRADPKRQEASAALQVVRNLEARSASCEADFDVQVGHLEVQYQEAQAKLSTFDLAWSTEAMEMRAALQRYCDSEVATKQAFDELLRKALGHSLPWLHRLHWWQRFLAWLKRLFRRPAYTRLGRQA